jgi:hypothetical protein
MSQSRPGRTPGGTNISMTGSPGGAVASGDGARASGYSVQNQGAADTLQRIGSLLAELEAGVRQLEPERADEAIEEIDRIRTETKRRKPSTEILRVTLERLAKVIGPAVGLLAKVDEVKDLITILVH